MLRQTVRGTQDSSVFYRVGRIVQMFRFGRGTLPPFLGFPVLPDDFPARRRLFPWPYVSLLSMTESTGSVMESKETSWPVRLPQRKVNR